MAVDHTKTVFFRNSMKHPHYDYTLDDALRLAQSLKYGYLTTPFDMEPGIAEAIDLISQSREKCGFNWITGMVAEEVLRLANGEDIRASRKLEWVSETRIQKTLIPDSR